MNIAQEQELKAHIIALSAYYQKQLSDMTVKMYVEDLSDLEFHQVMEAYRAWRKDEKNDRVPMPARIRAMINPTLNTDAKATEIASRIVEAVGKFGWSNALDAASYIGPVGNNIVKRFGGWEHLCHNLGQSIPQSIFFAQCKDLAKSQLEISKLGILSKEELLGYEKPKLNPTNEQQKKIANLLEGNQIKPLP